MVPTAMVCSSHFSTTLSLGDGPHWLKLNSDFGPFGIPDPGDGGGLDGPATAGRIGPGLVTTNVTARPVARARARAPLRCLDTRRAPPLIWTFASSAQSTRAMTPIAKATKASTPLQAAARDGCIGLCGQLDQDEWGDLLWFQQEPAEFCRFLALLPRSGAGRQPDAARPRAGACRRPPVCAPRLPARHLAQDGMRLSSAAATPAVCCQRATGPGVLSHQLRGCAELPCARPHERLGIGTSGSASDGSASRARCRVPMQSWTWATR